MRFKIELRRSFNEHGDLYQRLGMPKELYKRFHPDDQEFSPRCDGWAEFLEFLEEGENKAYKIKFEEVQCPDLEVASPEHLAPYLITYAGYLFEKMALQTEKGINTYATERELRRLKGLLSDLEVSFGVIFDPKVSVQALGPDTPLDVLRTLPDSASRYILQNGSTVFGTKSYSLAEKEFLLLLIPKKPIPCPPILHWTGKELVAVHEENLPPQLKEVIKK